MSSVTDMTKGVYRRIYGGFIYGARINRLSLEAEAWFWRLVCIADDYGNLPGTPAVVRNLTVGPRTVTVKQVAAWIDEIVAANLAVRYTDGGSPFLGLADFEEFQPAGKNGRRIKRYPFRPTADVGVVGESKAIQGNPDSSSPPIPIPTPIPKPIIIIKSDPAAPGDDDDGSRKGAGEAGLTAEQEARAQRLCESLKRLGIDKARQVVRDHSEAEIAVAIEMASGSAVRNRTGLVLSKLASGEAGREAQAREKRRTLAADSRSSVTTESALLHADLNARQEHRQRVRAALEAAPGRLAELAAEFRGTGAGSLVAVHCRTDAQLLERTSFLTWAGERMALQTTGGAA